MLHQFICQPGKAKIPSCSELLFECRPMICKNVDGLSKLSLSLPCSKHLLSVHHKQSADFLWVWWFRSQKHRQNDAMSLMQPNTKIRQQNVSLLQCVRSRYSGRYEVYGTPSPSSFSLQCSLRFHVKRPQMQNRKIHLQLQGAFLRTHTEV